MIFIYGLLALAISLIKFGFMILTGYLFINLIAIFIKGIAFCMDALDRLLSKILP